MITEINTILELWTVRDNLEGDYIQINDIDLSMTRPENAPAAYDPAYPYKVGDYSTSMDSVWVYIGPDPAVDWYQLWATATGWETIAFGNYNFKGHYDGDWHKITGMWCRDFSTTTNTFAGLFNSIGEGGTVEKLGIEDCDIFSMLRAGALAGRVWSGDVRYCYCTGVVDTEGASGGLIGMIEGFSPYPTSYVEDCWSSCDIITPDKHYAGGFTGRNDARWAQVVVRKCYSYGLVASIASTAAGFTTRRNSTNAVVSDCYYDKETSQKEAGEGFPRTTAEMKQQDTYVGWDFENVWGINAEINDGYPVLRGFHPGVDFTPPIAPAELYRKSLVFSQPDSDFIFKQGGSL